MTCGECENWGRQRPYKWGLCYDSQCRDVFTEANQVILNPPPEYVMGDLPAVGPDRDAPDCPFFKGKEKREE